jgi:hypothetical protein
MTQEENMETVTDDLRATEARIREAEADALAELSGARAALETAGRDDRAAYAAALAAGDELPEEGRTPKLIAQIRDIEKRRLPAFDDALWLVAEQTREAVRGAVPVDRFRSMKRWNPPHAVNDPSQPAATRHGQHRPLDVVAWVQGVHDVVVRAEREQMEKHEKDQRFKEAKRRVDAAQREYNGEQDAAFQQRLDAMNPQARTALISRLNSGASSAPYPQFDRHAFLEREGLLDDYGWTQPGSAIRVQGGRETRIEQVPASEMHATNSTEA